VDYVLKPIGRDRVNEAVAQVRARLSGQAPSAPPASAASLAAAARAPGQFVERVLVRDGAQVHVIPVERLDWIEAQDDYVAIRADGKTHLKPQALAEIANGLDPARFVRIHRSYVLNVERLARLELYAKDSRVAILKDGKQLPVSRAGYARLKELL
jgi:two-component system LytT family response regulator